MNELAVYIERLDTEQPGLIESILKGLDEIRMEVERECARGVVEFFETVSKVINEIAPPE